MRKNSSILATFLSIILTAFFLNCNGCDKTTTKDQKETITSITKQMIARAKTGNGNNKLKWDFLAKKLEDLENGKKVDLDEKDPQDGLTGLHYTAILGGDIDIAKALLDRGANLNVLDNNSITPLYTVAFFNNKKLAELFIAKGANKETKNKHGRTPLHVAAWNNNLEIVELLIKEGADKEAKDKDGKTPLDVVREENQKEGHDKIIALLENKVY